MDGIYARQSVDKKDSISIDTQIEFCEKEVQPGSQYRVYKDKGYSGGNTNRPEFQRMLNDIRAGTITRVIVYRLDRMSRSLLDFANLIDFFDSHGATFVSTQEKFDTGSPMSRAMLSITMVFAQLERETIQIRIKDNYYARGGKGMFLGGPTADGFNKIDTVLDGTKMKLLVENPERAPIIRMIYQKYGNEMLTLGEISKYLNEKKIPSSSGGVWTSSRISMLLRNPIYVKSDLDVYQYYKDKGCNIVNDPTLFVGIHGCYLYGKRKRSQRKYTTFEEHFLSLAPSNGLVEPDLFLKCQHRLDKNKQIDNSSWGTKTWLTGYIKCAHCGKALIPKNCGREHYYFFCSGKADHSCDHGENFGEMQAIETIVFASLTKVVESLQDIKVAASKKNVHDTNLMRAKIATIEEKISKLIDMSLEANDTTARYINEKVSKLDEEKQQIAHEIEVMESKKEDEVSVEDITLMLKEWPSMTNRQRNAVVSNLINKVVVDPNQHTVDIHWKHNFQLPYAN